VSNIVRRSLPDVPADVPSLSLHVLAKNAENVLGRLLDNILPYVQQVRFVLNDTTDASEKVIERRVDMHNGLRYTSRSGIVSDVQHVTAISHPEHYFEDVPASYEVGSPLSSELFEGPYTESPLLADWASVRNLGWDSDQEWRLFLDADDLVADPQKIPGLLCVLRDLGADLAAARYIFGRGPGGEPNSVAYRERLAKNMPTIRWEGRTHEVMAGGLRRVLVEDCLSVTDMKDNWGRGVRVPGRCFKVLYRDARLADWKVPARHLAYLVQEAPGMMPVEWVAGDLYDAYGDKSEQPEEQAWVLCMIGEMYEARGGYDLATRHYKRALGCHTSPKAAFRLCRAEFMRRNWVGCLEAYERGLSLATFPQILDDGPVHADSSKLFVAHAYKELGKMEQAREMARECARLFPRSGAVADLVESICGSDTEGEPGGTS
jgi:tetratricopeptide (TPR) repeat protein